MCSNVKKFQNLSDKNILLTVCSNHILAFSLYTGGLLIFQNFYYINHCNVIFCTSSEFPSELQLNKANASDTEAPFLDLHLSISNGFVSSKIYDKRDDFDFDIVNFPFLDGDCSKSSFLWSIYLSAHKICSSM